MLTGYRGDEYRRSPYSDKPLSGLKRLEKNKSIRDQFRFLAAWLKDVDQADLFSDTAVKAPNITFGNILETKGGRHLNESLWEPLESSNSEVGAQVSLIDDY